MYFKAWGNCTEVFYIGGKKGTVPYGLAEVERTIADDDFFRCHKKYLINHCFICEVNYKTNLFKLCNKTGESVSYIKVPASYRAIKKVKEYLRQKGYKIL